MREIRVAARDLDKHVAQLIAQGDTPGHLERGWLLTFELLKGIRDAARGAGADTAVMLIPLKLQLQDDALEGFRAAAGASMRTPDPGRPQEAARTFARDAGIEIIDLLPAFRSWTTQRRSSDAKASLHLQEGHWNVSGHRLAAEVAAQAIVDRQLVKARRPQ
jgi:hypothetical protein